MNQAVRTLTERIESGVLLSPATFEDVDLDRVLDQRDDDPFDSEWVRCNEDVQELSDGQAEDSDEIAVLAHRSFLATSEATDHHDVASYVSDDFRLIGEALLTGYDDPWLSGLLVQYTEGTIPAGEIERSGSTLAEIIGRL